MTDFLYSTKDVRWGKDGEKVLTVRGLSTQDLTIAIRTHKDSLTRAFSMIEGRLDDDQSLTEFGMELMEQFPELVALLIALAADKPDKAGEVLRLPAPLQLKLVEAIYELTIEDTGGLQDFLQNVFVLLNRMKVTTHSLNSLREGPGASTGT
ncbi:phage pre-tape measure protein [Marinobacter nauticus]|uniref:Uncharacterized protein n=1 Tax=Marinobacter nauticus TaxID=2743 RepID=A0A833JQH4_MARNT|nr:hypothetical protein [Marinobacter nauticus]KAE8546147.1 hypothetical protein F6453_1393 [Marinobacter nauticus]